MTFCLLVSLCLHSVTALIIASIHSTLGHMLLAIQTCRYSFCQKYTLIQIFGIQVQAIDDARTLADHGTTKLVVPNVAIVPARDGDEPLVHAIHAGGSLCEFHRYIQASLKGCFVKLVTVEYG